MTVSIQIEPESGVAIARCSGLLGRKDAEEGAAGLWKAPGWPGKVVVWDFRDATFDLSASDVREVAQFILRHQPATPPSRVAFVTPTDVDFGLARMFEAFRADPRTEVRVFRDYEDALDWVGSLKPGAT